MPNLTTTTQINDHRSESNGPTGHYDSHANGTQQSANDSSREPLVHADVCWVLKMIHMTIYSKATGIPLSTFDEWQTRACQLNDPNLISQVYSGDGPWGSTADPPPDTGTEDVNMSRV